MSVNLTSLVWEVRFPTSTQKLLMLRIADYADDDGAGVYPSISEVARQVGASERQVQYAIRALEGVTLLVRETHGGSGPKRTNVWRIDVDLLARLALQEVALAGSHDAVEIVENEGAIIAPRTLARVQSRLLRVQSTTVKGEVGRTQTKENQTLEQKDAQARASHEEARASRAVASLPIRPGDASWDAWLETLDPSLRDAAVAAGEIRVSKRWPGQGAVIHTKLTPSFTARMTGDAA